MKGRLPRGPGETEAGFTTAVIALARLHGWMVYHALPLRTKAGEWRTGTQGDVGFPDVIAVKAAGGRVGRLVVAELKVKTAVTPQQDIWLNRFATVPGVEVYVWRPHQWNEILAVFGEPLPPAGGG
jgi:hypothetical protein